jgi:hypothetical protein
LFGLDGAMPVFVANANLVTALVNICFGFAAGKVYSTGFIVSYIDVIACVVRPIEPESNT